MDAFGIMGFVFGMTGFVLAITAMTQIAALKKGVEGLRAELERKG